MNVHSNQHAKVPVSWHIANLAKLLAADLRSGIGAKRALGSEAEPASVLEMGLPVHL
jgi:hypothetical protein